MKNTTTYWHVVRRGLKVLTVPSPHSEVTKVKGSLSSYITKEGAEAQAKTKSA